jgi:mevalonate kinase
MHIFKDMGYLIKQFMLALEHADLPTLGSLMNIHQLLQEKMGTSCPESDRLIEAALAGGALGGKISGSGCGGIIIALSQPGLEKQVAAAIDAAGGKSYIVQTGAAGAHIDSEEAWSTAVT